jgi:hypothetical protein
MKFFQSSFFTKLFKIARITFKVIATIVIAYCIYGIFFIIEPQQRMTGIYMIVFLFLPILIFMFFKTSFISKYPKLVLIYKIVRIFYSILIVLFFVALFWRTDYVGKNKDAINKINNSVISLNDVLGTNLPPKPNKALNDLTVSGFDVNNNGIRDDVELAIFEKYPNSAKIRAGMLQYAQALQLELTEVNSESTMLTYLEKDDAAYSCLLSTVEDYINSDEWKILYEATKEKKEEVENLILNTEMRKQKYNEVYEKYMTSYSSKDGGCIIDISSLPN